MVMMGFGAACDAGLAAAMAEDDTVVTWGEDVRLLRRELLVRFGEDRVLDTPISEAAFVQAGVGAAMGGLRPVVEVMLVDFLPTAWSALLNYASKVSAFSDGRWHVPLVVRSACGGGYGDGGQHEQALWGPLSSMPGLKVVVPSTPADAAGLMLTAVRDQDPVVLLEHKLLNESWLDYLGGSRRPGIRFDVPSAGAEGEVPMPVRPVPIGIAALRRRGADVALVGVGVGVHRAYDAALELAESGVDAAVLDLRTVSPLDRDSIVDLARGTGRLVAVDEDYTTGGLTGEVAAVLAEASVGARFARVAVHGVIPFARERERDALPTVDRIVEAVRRLE